VPVFESNARTSTSFSSLARNTIHPGVHTSAQLPSPRTSGSGRPVASFTRPGSCPTALPPA
jgi:hypothetical protein